MVEEGSEGMIIEQEFILEQEKKSEIDISDTTVTKQQEENKKDSIPKTKIIFNKGHRYPISVEKLSKYIPVDENTAEDLTTDDKYNIDYKPLDNTPLDKIESITVVKNTAEEKRYGSQNKGDVIVVTTKRDKPKLISPKDSLKLATVIDYYTEGSKPEEKKKVVYRIGATNMNSQPLIILDGKEMGRETLKNTDPKTIKSISLLKDTAAIRLYGEKGKHGVIFINLNEDDPKEKDAHLRIEAESIQIDEHPKEMNLEFHFDQNGSPKVVKPKSTTSYQTISKGNVKRLFDNIIKNKENSKSLVMINDKETSYEAFSKLNPEDIEQIGYYKGEVATKLFGEKGKDGVILAKSK